MSRPIVENVLGLKGVQPGVIESTFACLHQVCGGREPVGRLVLVVTLEVAYLTSRVEAIESYHHIGLHRLATAIVRWRTRGDELLAVVVGEASPQLRSIPLGKVRACFAAVARAEANRRIAKPEEDQKMTTATLGEHPVTHARVHIPAWGVPWAEVGLLEEASLTGAVKLTIADLEFVGTIMSGGPGPVGRSRFRIGCGAGSWGKPLPAKAYANDAGVKAKLVLSDAAREAGEKLDAASVPATSLGSAFARESAVAARVLEQCFPAGWYVGTDGITRIGKRPSTPLTQTGIDVLSVDRACGTIELAAEAIARIVPGVVVEGLEAVDVMHELEPGSLRSTIWTAGIAPTTRRLAALRRIIEQLDPLRRFRGIYEYRVLQQVKMPDREWLDLQPVRVSIGMPNLNRVPIRPGMAGLRADVEPGTRVLVTFVDANPARPMVVAFQEPDGNGWLPIRLQLNATEGIELGGEGALPAARQTDPVVAGPFAGTITRGSLKTTIN